MNHYDVRSPYSTECGRKLSYEFDIAVFKEIIKAARSAANYTGGKPGTKLTNDKFKIAASPGAANNSEKALALAEAIFSAATVLDQNDAPATRYCALRPAEYYSIVQNKDAITNYWGGQGSYADGKVFKIADIALVKSNHVPSTDTTGTDTYHGVDASKTIGVIWCPEAVGTVKLMDLSMQMEYLTSYQGTLMVARYAMGHGILRPECAVELALNTLLN